MLAGTGLTEINRDIQRGRLEAYADEMVAGRWRFSPDPIVVTEDGYIINGQHRLAAASLVVWEEGDTVPEFLVVWGIDKRAALMMDEATRTPKDRRKIALGFAGTV
jgi:hypothetical protein